MKTTFCVLLFLASLRSVPSLLADVLDQSFTPNANLSTYSVFDDRTPPLSGTWFQELSQTFTVGLPGVLSAIEVDIYGVTQSGPLQFSLRPTLNGAPLEADSLLLANRTIPYSEMVAAIGDGPPGGFFRIDISDSQIAVQPGQVLAIGLRSASNQGYGWIGSHVPDGYLGGSAFARNDSHATWSDFGSDLGFKTYVIPEPTSLHLGILMMLSFLGSRWRGRAG